MPVAFIAGFVFDYLTLTRIDRLYDNLVVLAYVLIAGLIIVSLYYFKDGRFTFLPIALLFVFGNLFSAFLVFYSRSASLAASWPFILILIGLLVGNDFFKAFYSKLVFRLSVYYFILFSYFIFVVPLVVGRMGGGIFVLSGAVSLAVIGLFVHALRKIDAGALDSVKRRLAWSIGAVFLAVNVFYFTNLIPPIPLSLKEAGVYYGVERTSDGAYETEDTDRRWYEVFHRYKRMPLDKGGEIYVFSSVFAPTKLRTNIVHDWQYYDSELDEWQSVTRIEFAVVGGRDGGYRGFSKKSSLSSGYWRANIETPNGLLIGRVKFLVP